MPYRTIVCGTDGSITARAALERAAGLAKRCRAELVILCAFDPPRVSQPAAESVLEAAGRSAERARVRAALELRQGEPAAAMLDVVDRRDADLVVVGNKGMGQPRKVRLGSVPDRIAHAGACDVLIVDTRDATEREASTPRGYRQVVVATDGSPTASEAARKGMELSMLVGADVTLVFVGDPIVGAIRLEETASAAPDGVEVTSIVRHGEPAKEICAAAREREADLLVVGNKGMSGPRRYILASVPNEVAHAAASDVLIVKTVDRSLDDIQPGHGAIVDVGGRRVAVYRDDGGALTALSPRCTHMGCSVAWNDADRTWDCPCHGSRFAVDGTVVSGPAAKPLPVQELAAR